MFTGIVAEVGKVVMAGPRSLEIAAGRTLRGIEIGDSIAVSGVCLTVTAIKPASFCVDVMPETLKRTNLGLLRAGDMVNLESPLTLQKGLGGHLVQGHVDAAGRVASVVPDGEAKLVRFEAPPEVMRYIVEKGFIAIDGVSLTVVNRDKDSFQVSLVDYTRQNTTLGGARVGDLVNLEVDVVAKYVERFSLAGYGGVTLDLLEEHGFLVN